jgi:hypothetical protein
MFQCDQSSGIAAQTRRTHPSRVHPKGALRSRTVGGPRVRNPLGFLDGVLNRPESHEFAVVEFVRRQSSPLCRGRRVNSRQGGGRPTHGPGAKAPRGARSGALSTM